MMSLNKISHKLIAFILIPVIVLSTFMSYLSYKNLLILTESNLTTYLQDVNQQYNDYIDLKLNTIMQKAASAAHYIETTKNINDDLVLKFIEKKLLSDSLTFGAGIYYNKDVYNKQNTASFYTYRHNNKFKSIIINDNNANEYINYQKEMPDWWRIPSEKHHAGWTKPYIDDFAGGIKMVTYYYPFFIKDKFAGVVTFDLSLKNLREILNLNEKVFEQELDAKVYLLSMDSSIIYSEIEKNIGINAFEINENQNYGKDTKLVLSQALMGARGKSLIKSSNNKTEFIAFYLPLHSANITSISVLNLSEIKKETFNELKPTLLILVTFILVLTIIIFVVSKRVSNPISNLSALSLKIADGDYQTKIEIKSKDEIGVLANNFMTMQTKLMKREQEILEANKQLLVLDDAKNEFLKLISHEIRTPLNGIVGSAYFLSDTIDDPELQDFLDMLKESVDRLDNFSKTALELTQMQTIGRESKKKALNINSIISKVIDEKQNSANEKNITVLSNFTEDNDINGIEEYFKRAIEELIGNAIKFSNEGINIKVKTFKEDGKIKISVTDTGEVIPLEKIEEITKPFGLAKEHYDKHIGLGLAYVQTFLDIHHASMEIKSNKEETVITLIFDGA